jgi:hypothetical protein
VRALERVGEKLRGYHLELYLAAPEVQIAAELACQSTGMTMELVSAAPIGQELPPHDNVLRMHGRARVSIGLSISDAISTSFLEAMMMGSFPIQSNTGCANEWARDGETALFVHPEDPAGVAAAIERAIADDALVDRAAELNARTLAERYDRSRIQDSVVEMYDKILARPPSNHARGMVSAGLSE